MVSSSISFLFSCHLYDWCITELGTRYIVQCWNEWKNREKIENFSDAFIELNFANYFFCEK